MLRRSSRISNRKMLKTEGGDAVATSCDSSETRAPHGSSSVLTLAENEVKPTELRRSSRISNLKKLKTGNEVDDQTYAAPDYGGGNFSGSVSASLNPLQNVVILRNLFELCPVKVLATCRLVCKQWNEESLLSWRNSSPLRFTLENRKLFIKSIWDVEARQAEAVPLQNFLEYAADPKNQCHSKPYRFIRIRNSTIGSDIASKKQFEIFWNALGSNLTRLELWDCKFPDDGEFRKIIFTCCPKLKRLFILDCKFSTKAWNVSVEELNALEQRFERNEHLKVLRIMGEKRNERKLPVSWLELLSHFPRMSSLSIISSDYKMPVEEFNSLTNAIRVIRKRDGNLLPFKVFGIGDIRISAGPLTQQKLAVFRELRLPLQSILANLGSNFFKDNFMRTCHQLDDVLKITFEGGFLRFCKHVACLKFLPNLDKLEICCNERFRPPRSDMELLNTGSSEATHLTLKLRRLTLCCWLQDADIAKLHDWMPNVTDLMIYVKNNKQLGIVCEKWKKLESLCVFGYDLTDAGVVGIKNGTRANITSLQNLESFYFTGNKLTAKSVFHGFLKLPKLDFLVQFGDEPLLRWGERARQALEDRDILLIEDND